MLGMILIFCKRLGATPRSRSLLVLVAAFVVLLASACGQGNGDDAGDQPVLVVATTTVLGDLVANVVGDMADVAVLTPIGADPHEFAPSAQQATLVVAADLVVANGLFFEEGLADLLESSRADGANVLEIAPLLDPIPFGGHDDADEDEEHAGEDDDHGHGDLDPHVWMDALRMADAAGIIAAELRAIDDTIDWAAGAAVYADELAATDKEIARILAPIPPERRKLVTNHEAFGYLANRYDLEVIGTVIPGGSTLAEPSPAQLEALIAEIEHEGVPAIFAETIDPSALAEAVAAEVGEDIEVVELYSDSLGEPGSGADTLIGMLIINAERIAAALQ